MLKTHKIVLNPNSVQPTQLARYCGYACVAYNHALSDFKTGLNTRQWRSRREMCRRFNAIKSRLVEDSRFAEHEQYDWCREMSQNVSKNAMVEILKNPISWGTNRCSKNIAQSDSYWSVYHKNPNHLCWGTVKI